MCDETVNRFFILLWNEFLKIKIVYQNYCGVDVHKSFLVATIIKATYEVHPSYEKKLFFTSNNSILQIKGCLNKNQYRNTCMESTNKYCISVLIFWMMKLILPSLIPNRQKLLKVIRMIQKIQSELMIYLD